MPLEMESTALAIEAPEPSRVLPELGPLVDVPFDIEIVLGLSAMRLKDVTTWEAGSLLTLNKAAGEPLEVYVSGELFGYGEIEASYENVGLRITNVVA